MLRTMGLDIRSLRQVIAIRKHGSFARAADALGVSQPSLSKSVARLEDELKLKLFDRTAKGSSLTPVGELIIERADVVIAETRDLARDAALLAGGEIGTVRIGCTTALTVPLLQPLVQRLAQRHPGLRVHAEAAASARLLPLLDSRDLDVVFIGASAGQILDRLRRSLDTRDTGRIRRQPLASAGERAADPDPATGGVQGSRLQSPGSSNARLIGLESENLGWYTASHYEILLPLVLSGDTVLLAPTFVVQPYLEAGEMVILDVQWRHSASFHFATTRAASFSPVVREIAEHAQAIGAQLRDHWRGVAGRFTEA